MESEPNWELLAKYVAGECSSREDAEVQAWTRQDLARSQRVARLRRIWAAADAPTERWDAEAAWQKLRPQLREKEEAAGKASSPGPARSARARRAERRRPARPVRKRLRQAAAVALAVAAGVLLFVFLRGLLSPGPPAPGGKVFATQAGQRATLRLTDGTEVRLNADSRLTLSEGFQAGVRAVRLEGEAYFEVARDSARPFRVRTREATVEVRGTAFNVEAYPGEEETQVAVSEGEVDLRPTAALTTSRPAGRDSVARLKPRSLGVASKRGLQAVRRNVDLSERLAWTEGRLVFEDALPREVARKLGRWYGLRVEVRVPPGSAVVGLNASFEDEPLSEVLRSIAVALNLEYERAEDTVTFYR